MGLFKFFDMPEKAPGEILNTADRLYLIKLIVISSIFTICLTLAGVQFFLERHIHRIGNKAKILEEWAKKADFANEMLEDMFRVQQIKESYNKQGIKATEATGINLKNKEANNETKD